MINFIYKNLTIKSFRNGGEPGQDIIILYFIYKTKNIYEIICNLFLFKKMTTEIEEGKIELILGPMFSGKSTRLIIFKFIL